MRKTEPLLHIALMRPEIPQNTGNIGRLCLGIEARLHLIHPLGFNIDEKAVRRAGLDYWKKVDIQEHEDESSFLRWLEKRPFHLFSTKGRKNLISSQYPPGCVLVFGSESKGLPMDLINKHKACVIPMTGEIRSLNLSNAVAIAAYTALSKISPDIFSGTN